MDDVTEGILFKMFPNPASAAVTVALPVGVQMLEVLDVTGKLVHLLPLTGQPETIVLNTANYTQGLYFVRVSHKQGAAVQKLQIVH